METTGEKIILKQLVKQTKISHFIYQKKSSSTASYQKKNKYVLNLVTGAGYK